MKTRYILFISLTITVLLNGLLFGQLVQITEPNMMSEANIYEDQNGTRYSELVTFKFKYKMVNMNRGEVIVSESKILYPAFRQLLNSLRNQFGNFVIKKAIPDVIWGDTIGINKRTNQTVIVNDLSQIYRIIFSNPVPTEQVVNILNTHSNVKYAEGPIIAYLTISPNDPWYLDQNYRWSFDVINAETAWDITKGSPLIGIGINDRYYLGTSSQLHLELVNKVVYMNISAYGDHGTIVAGVAGAQTNNSTDIASLGWNLNLLLHDWGVQGIYNLITAGADVINFSWMTSDSYSLKESIQNALLQGRVCVAAAGNDQPPIPGVKYPAAYNFGTLGQVIAVSGTEMVNGIERFIQGFNYSPGTDPINDPTNAFIDCAAPGANYRGLNDVSPTGTKHIWKGTSISAPFVSAMIGLMLSVNSTLTPNQIYEIITRTTDKIGANPYNSIGWNQYLGYGRIDAANAVNVATGAPSKPRGLSVNISSNNHPYLSWSINPENNIISYVVEKYITQENGWQYYAQTTNNFFEDMNESYCPPGQACGSHPVKYRIRAINNINKTSLPSLSVTTDVRGYYLDKKFSNTSDLVKFKLFDNYPNPFNPTTKISWQSPVNGQQTLKVYDVLGREVATLVDEYREAGSYEIEFDATNLSSGMYIYRLQSGSYSDVKKMILSK
ncbi:MAG: S8 family peptidase [Ignavibacterium sp.]|nr:S8 family peptidase [Ignavibacterium sp.]